MIIIQSDNLNTFELISPNHFLFKTNIFTNLFFHLIDSFNEQMCLFQVITSQKIQEKSQDFHTNEYFTRSKRTSRSTTSILSGQEKHQTEISQDR